MSTQEAIQHADCRTNQLRKQFSKKEIINIWTRIKRTVCLAQKESWRKRKVVDDHRIPGSQSASTPQPGSQSVSVQRRGRHDPRPILPRACKTSVRITQTEMRSTN
uniref:Uncharacterized protein n=1 Tax=Cacopsylla melanoneura TaxID=428564 RepID=A0A8D8RNG8_9HEMI